MKNSVFMFLAMLSMTLASCSLFNSDPVEPNIIGSGNLQYEVKTDTWFVVIDSTQYTVTNVTLSDRNPRSFSKTQDIEPVEGMLVTVFTSPRKAGVQAVTGKQSAEQIEKLYQTNGTIALIILGVLLLCVVGVTSRKNEEVPVVNADM